MPNSLIEESSKIVAKKVSNPVIYKWVMIKIYPGDSNSVKELRNQTEKLKI